MLVVLSPIFVADTKLIYDDNFVAPLKFHAGLLTIFSLAIMSIKEITFLELQV